MAEINFLYRHWKKQQLVFQSNFIRLQQRLDATAIHDIRVATKKLRAFLSFYCLLQKDQTHPHYLGKTEALFEVLGKQRNIEVCLELLAAHKKENGTHYKELHRFLQTQLKVSKGWTNEEIHRYHKKELAQVALLLKEELRTITDQHLVLELNTLIHQQVAATKKVHQKPHQVRKQLKEIYYWITLLPDKENCDQYHPEDLHIILENLGHWQDMETLSILCHHFRKDHLPGSFTESDTLRILEDQLAEKKKLLQKLAMDKVRKWIEKIEK
jgi:CHAD domain-containing protein